MAYDPSTVAAMIAALAAKADDKRFPVDSAPTRMRALELGRYPAAQALLPGPGEDAYLVAYTLLYRRVTFTGGIVVGLANIGTARGILAEDAGFQVALYDLRNPWTEYTPGGKGVASGP